MEGMMFVRVSLGEFGVGERGYTFLLSPPTLAVRVVQRAVEPVGCRALVEQEPAVRLSLGAVVEFWPL